jgi:hypothetical protein
LAWSFENLSFLLASIAQYCKKKMIFFGLAQWMGVGKKVKRPAFLSWDLKVLHAFWLK